MNIRLLTVVLGLASVSLVACTVKEGDGTGGGGDGGTGGGSTSTSTSDGGSTSTSTSDGGAGGGTGGGDNGFAACQSEASIAADGTCAGCGDVVTYDACTPEHVCAEGSADLLAAFELCVCGDEATPGKCATECADRCSGAGGEPTSECSTCIIGDAENPGQCKTELEQCAGDVKGS